MANIHLAEAAVKVSRPSCAQVWFGLAISPASYAPHSAAASTYTSASCAPSLRPLPLLSSWAWTAACVCCPSACATGPPPPPSGCAVRLLPLNLAPAWLVHLYPTTLLGPLCLGNITSN